ncbi:MAG: 3-hydroxyacyl-CoA dehydrogenase, partial [Roseovarius sp.]
YRYGEDGRAQRSAETEALILAESARKGIARQPVPETEIMARLLAAMQDEGACVLDEGIAQSAADIDVVIVNAFGFPRWKGGPMFAGGA